MTCAHVEGIQSSQMVCVYVCVSRSLSLARSVSQYLSLSLSHSLTLSVSLPLPPSLQAQITNIKKEIEDLAGEYQNEAGSLAESDGLFCYI